MTISRNVRNQYRIISKIVLSGIVLAEEGPYTFKSMNEWSANQEYTYLVQPCYLLGWQGEHLHNCSVHLIFQRTSSGVL